MSTTSYKRPIEFLIDTSFKSRRLIAATYRQEHVVQAERWLNRNARAQGGDGAFELLCLAGYDQSYQHHHEDKIDQASMIVTPKKPMIVYKKVRGLKESRFHWCCIAVLELVPGEPVRIPLNCNFLKCRTTVAYCTRLYAYGRPDISVPRARSMHDERFIYTPGGIIVPRARFDYSSEECATGVHFFFSLKYAVKYGS